MRLLNLLIVLAIGFILLVQPYPGFGSQKELSIVKVKTSGDEKEVYLGAFLQPLDRKLRKALNVDAKHGVLIVSIVEDSPAEKAGLEEDDIIVKVDGKNVRRVEDIKGVLARKKIGDTINVEFLRDNSARSVTVKLEKSRAKDPEMKIWSMLDTPINQCLGIKVADMDENLASYFQVPKNGGALVLSVEAKSPAEESGIKSGDVISKVNGAKIASVADLEDVLADMEQTDSVKIVLIRKGAEKNLVAELEPDCWDQRTLQVFPDPLHKSLPRVKIYPDDLRLKLGKPLFSPDSKELRELKKEMKKLKEEMQELKKDLKKQ